MEGILPQTQNIPRDILRGILVHTWKTEAAYFNLTFASLIRESSSSFELRVYRGKILRYDTTWDPGLLAFNSTIPTSLEENR